jgi:SAM-dependent methyltransferase
VRAVRLTRDQLPPVPPDDLLTRIGISADFGPERRRELFDRIGRDAVADVLSALPADWQWEGRAVLDFGCGSGRMLRHFVPFVDLGVRLFGCDIHAPTIEWLRTTYPDDVEVALSGEEPPLEYADATFDLVYAGSVFSHLPDWAPWLLEIRRVLRPGGLFVASIHGSGYWHVGVAGRRGEPWDEARTGLLVEGSGSGFDATWGPAVYVSDWWLRAHWSRALTILRYASTGFALPDDRGAGQAWVIARRDDDAIAPTAAALRAPSEDPRELPAAVRAQWLAYAELNELQPWIASLTAEVNALRGANDELERRCRQLTSSKSWRLTAPLRRVGRLARGR